MVEGTGPAPLPDLLFVYGTLWTGSGYREAKRLASRCLNDLGPAWIHGRLYDLGRHPAVVPAQRANEHVHGRLCALSDRDSCLARLDAFEDCDPNDPQAGLYRRERVRAFRARTVGTPGGADTSISCWVYLFNGRLTGRPRIRHGDYRRWLTGD